MTNCTQRRIGFGFNFGRAGWAAGSSTKSVLPRDWNLQDYDIPVETSSDSNRTCRAAAP